ncbi:MAG: AsmA-like C-terminal domain-containing protein [Desulfobulbaceae bacterium]|nr:AsmA-like C-terminal domain-containing protein [Desulfobulbaceae bacterium]HIJ79817.1 AsmA family protein [Deltaproteobacteria bacterium]
MRTFKLTVKIVICVLLTLAALVLIVPRMLELDKIKQQLVNRVEQKLASRIAIGQIQWQWLPLPHVTLSACELDNEAYTIVLPVARIYPDWRSIFTREVDVTDVYLVEPQFTVKKIPDSSRQLDFKLLPQIELSVERATLHFAENSQLPYAANKEFYLGSITGELEISSSTFNFSLSGKPSFGDNFSIEGEVALDGSAYQLKIDSRKLRLHDAFHTIGGGALLPLESVANFKGGIKGKGLDNIELNLVGDLPCLLAHPAVEQNLISCGFVDLAFKKQGADMFLKINDFELLEPGLTLTGEINRQIDPEDADNPVWTLGLAGENLNLSKIRKTVLTLWPDHPVAREVCDIVQGGKAGKASYQFRGPVSEFNNIRAMTITAAQTDATILVPYGKLLLEHAAGNMLIADGILSVQQATANLGNSSGRDCELRLGLTDDNHYFSLDVEVDGDLAELPEVLRSLIDDRIFLEQLAMFSNISGRANGHLHVGENLNDLKVTLLLAEMNGSAAYKPLRWPVKISRGQLTILPGQVQWQDVEASYGRHQIPKTAGKVDWSGKISVEITDLDATLLSADLDLSRQVILAPLQKDLKDISSKVKGKLVLTETRVFGLLDEPASWKYRTNVKFDDVVVTSPQLPAPIKVNNGELLLTEKELNVTRCAATLLDSSFKLTGKALHDGNALTSGALALSGLAKEKLGPWLKGLALVPPPFFPALPFTLENADFAWDKEKLFAKGNLSAGVKKKGAPRISFSVDSSISKPLVVDLAIKGIDEQADIVIDFLDNIPETFNFTWKGRLSEKTLDALLENKAFLQGNIAGDFQLLLPADPTATVFAGELSAKGLNWHWDGSEISNIDVAEMHLVGTGEILDIKQLLLGLADNESVAITGPLYRSAQGLELNVDLQSLSLSRKTIFSFLDDLELIRHEIAEETGGENNPNPWSITGEINFDLQEFVSGDRDGGLGRREDAPLIWNPLRGKIRLFPGWKAAANITSGRLCCLYTTGEWYSTPELGQSNFNIISACETTPQFELILPCLGYPQDLIEGDFSLSGRLVGALNDWRDGYLDVHSAQGRILRMTLLSKIFKVVNVTDIFTSTDSGPDGEQKKGFAYNELVLNTKVKENNLIIEQAFIKGEGLNIYAEGKMNINTYDLDLVVLVAPLKTLDTIISNVPLVGRVLAGKTGTVVAIPVSVKGNIRDPKITVLDPGAVGQGILNIIKRTLLLPFYILEPVIPDMKPYED